MNSPFALLFLAIQERIRLQVPEVKWVDADLGQLESYESRPPVLFPCVLIRMQDFTFSSMGQNSQIAEGSVLIRLAVAPFSSAASSSNDTVKAKALEFYEIDWKLYKALQGFVTPDGSILVRESSETEDREDALHVRATTFSTTFQDNSAGYDYDTVEPALVVEVPNPGGELPPPPSLP